jgi:hypothetical protein
MVGGTLGLAGGGYWYMQNKSLRERAEKAKALEASVGQAQVGGPFKLTDTNGKPFASSQLHGEFSILYFGFTHCPDICPDELEKMAAAIDAVGVAPSPGGRLALRNRKFACLTIFDAWFGSQYFQYICCEELHCCSFMLSHLLARDSS